MGSDMIVVTNEASANGTTLFGLNHHAAPSKRHQVKRVSGGPHDLGEMLHTSAGALPQARQTFSALGLQRIGEWGFTHGINENRVALGVTQWRSRLASAPGVLTGSDLVRLTLERSHSAHHAVEVLSDLICRHGQGVNEAGAQHRDHIFLIGDREEAYVLEATGRYWALLECRQMRVVTDAAMIRQDWRRLAPGLADHVIQQGWWQDDGSKIDFVRCLSESTDRSRAAQKRWGRASLALAQQHGAIDLHFLRRMLAEHYESSIDSPASATTDKVASSFLVDLHKGDLPLVAWVALGAPAVALYFPIPMAGELPAGFAASHPEVPTIEDRTRDLERYAADIRKDRNKLASVLERLQTRFDQDADDFLIKAHDCVRRCNDIHLAQLATTMMHNHVDLFEREYRRLFNIEEKPTHSIHEDEEVLFFA